MELLVNYCFDTRCRHVQVYTLGRLSIDGFSFERVAQFNLEWIFSKLDSGFQSLVGFRILSAGFRIPKPRIPDSRSKKFQDSGIRIPLHGATFNWPNKPFQKKQSFTWNILFLLIFYVLKILFELACVFRDRNPVPRNLLIKSFSYTSLSGIDNNWLRLVAKQTPFVR